MAKRKEMADNKESPAAVLGGEASLRGSQAVCKVCEQGEAASKKQIPSAPAAEESPTEGRRSSMTRITQRGPRPLAFLSFQGSVEKSSAGNPKRSLISMALAACANTMSAARSRVDAEPKKVAASEPSLVHLVKSRCPQSRLLINLVSVGLIRGSFCPPATRDLRT